MVSSIKGKGKTGLSYKKNETWLLSLTPHKCKLKMDESLEILKVLEENLMETF
jgi:hypothetical protein